MATVKAVQAASYRALPYPLENPIRSLIQQTSGARPIQAGISTFHERSQSSTSHASSLEISFGSFDNAEDNLNEDNVAVALTFLGRDIMMGSRLCGFCWMFRDALVGSWRVFTVGISVMVICVGVTRGCQSGADK